MISMNILLVIALAPLLGSAIAGLFGKQVGRAGAHWVTILGVAVSCALSCWVLYQLVAQVLHDTGLDPSRLEVEVTESAVMEDPEVALEQITVDQRILVVERQR